MLKKITTKLRKNLKVIEKIGLVTTSLLFCTTTCFAGVGDSKLATGTTNLINDLTNWLMILAPVLTVLLVGYYLLRKSAFTHSLQREGAFVYLGTLPVTMLKFPQM